MTSTMVLPISIVIPVRNEAANLGELFASLVALDPAPAEVVFVDTGSVDGTHNQLLNWREESTLPIQVCEKPGAYPGSARNLGVTKAKQDWIAFLDVGTVPKSDWLGALWQCRQNADSVSVYGCCRFDSEDTLGRMLCAASYGVDRLLPVLPASLFQREVFQRAGWFEEQLRAGEDILWKNALQNADIALPVCEQAVVEYRHFAPSLWQAIRKQYVYEQSAAVAGVGGGFRALILFVHLLIYPAFLVIGKSVLPMLFVYLLLRGVIDPFRRSKRWWSSSWQIVVLPAIVGMIDIAGALGRLTAFLGMSPFRLVQSSNKKGIDV